MEGFFEKFIFTKIYYLFFRLSWIVTSCYSVKTVDEIRILGANSRIICCVHETCDIFELLCSVEFWILIKYNINYFSSCVCILTFKNGFKKCTIHISKIKSVQFCHNNSLKSVYMHRQNVLSYRWACVFCECITEMSKCVKKSRCLFSSNFNLMISGDLERI